MLPSGARRRSPPVVVMYGRYVRERVREEKPGTARERLGGVQLAAAKVRKRSILTPASVKGGGGRQGREVSQVEEEGARLGGFHQDCFERLIACDMSEEEGFFDQSPSRQTMESTNEPRKRYLYKDSGDDPGALCRPGWEKTDKQGGSEFSLSRDYEMASQQPSLQNTPASTSSFGSVQQVQTVEPQGFLAPFPQHPLASLLLQEKHGSESSFTRKRSRKPSSPIPVDRPRRLRSASLGIPVHGGYPAILSSGQSAHVNVDKGAQKALPWYNEAPLSRSSITSPDTRPVSTEKYDEPPSERPWLPPTPKWLGASGAGSEKIQLPDPLASNYPVKHLRCVPQSSLLDTTQSYFPSEQEQLRKLLPVSGRNNIEPKRSSSNLTSPLKNIIDNEMRLHKRKNSSKGSPMSYVHPLVLQLSPVAHKFGDKLKPFGNDNKLIKSMKKSPPLERATVPSPSRSRHQGKNSELSLYSGARSGEDDTRDGHRILEGDNSQEQDTFQADAGNRTQIQPGNAPSVFSPANNAMMTWTEDNVRAFWMGYERACKDKQQGRDEMMLHAVREDRAQILKDMFLQRSDIATSQDYSNANLATFPPLPSHHTPSNQSSLVAPSSQPALIHVDPQEGSSYSSAARISHYEAERQGDLVIYDETPPGGMRRGRGRSEVDDDEDERKIKKSENDVEDDKSTMPSQTLAEEIKNEERHTVLESWESHHPRVTLSRNQQQAVLKPSLMPLGGPGPDNKNVESLGFGVSKIGRGTAKRRKQNKDGKLESEGIVKKGKGKQRDS
ncbi:uncharacterized protein L203_101893 [Cryptococcus depauperatus CBS 7841]|uniref:Uncharacterized protein n=1 Tax=Cryptococcus depauperatus CBS 7841 TaxID=1295531 RepID=A0AAJ8JQS6_9TREE